MNRILVKVLRSGSAASLLIGLSYSQGLAAPMTNKQTEKPAAATDASERVTPEEAKRRKDWTFAMHRKATPKKGCFSADYPSTEWKEVPCVPAPNIPLVPRSGAARPFVIGYGDDIMALAPSGAIITQAIGSFENVNVSSLSGKINNIGGPINNAYTLQLNTNFMPSSPCSTSPNPDCVGWEQWVYFNEGTKGRVFIQYWLRDYNTWCPSGWNTYPVPTAVYCWRNNSGGGVEVPNQPISNMANWTLSGTATAVGDTFSMGTGVQVYKGPGDDAVEAAAHWTTAEFNIFGPGGGSQANFNDGASVNVRTEIFYGGNAAPGCVADGTTAETNNLSFGPNHPAATGPGPAIIFQESTAGGAPTSCAAATTIGDTHLRTFDNLLYDFQAAGDFTLAEVAPDFTVQTRQVSGAPTWPDATVNKAVAARFGKTTVAICGGAEARVFVDGKDTILDEGKLLELPGGVVMRRQGDVCQIAGENGDSVRATLHSYNGTHWIDVSVGLGKWPASVKGLIANVNGNLNQIATRDNFVLTNPFNFDELYHRFADSWRVSGQESLLSVCNAERVEVGAPKRAFYAKDLNEAVREKARGLCAAAGVKPGALLDACTLDVAVIGQDAAVEAFVAALPPAAVGVIAGGGASGSVRGILASRWWLILLLVLALVRIVWLVARKKP